MFVEMGMFEIATFLSQFDGQAVLATVVVIFQFVVLFYTVPVGISTATTILIGQIFQSILFSFTVRHCLKHTVRHV